MNPVNAQDYIKKHQPMKWSRSTIADGKWMQDISKRSKLLRNNLFAKK